MSHDLSRLSDKDLKLGEKVFGWALAIQKVNRWVILTLGLTIAILGPLAGETISGGIAKLLIVGAFYWFNGFLIYELGERVDALEKEIEKRRLKQELRPR